MPYPKNGPISEIEDVDDSTFLNHPRHGSKGYVLGSEASPEDQRLQLLQEKKRIEQQTLQSSKNALGLIYETEKIGVHTAEELLHQREQLENVNEKLDTINSIMRQSQKHLNSMKSVFGGLKTLFTKTDKTSATTANASSTSKKMPTSVSENALANTLEKTFNNDTINNQINDFRVKHKLNETESSRTNTKPLDPYQQHSQEVNEQLDNNLAEMGLGISRLKQLALGLGNEIETQNKLLDTITTKSEKAQDVVNNQNRQMNRILKS